MCAGETVSRPGIAYGDPHGGNCAGARSLSRVRRNAQRGYRQKGGWIDAADENWSGGRVIFSGRPAEGTALLAAGPAVGETVTVSGVRFTVIGVMARKIQLSKLLQQ